MDEFLLAELRKLKKACARRDIAALKDFGEEVAEKAFVEDNPQLLNVVVVAYAVAKFLEKPYIVNTPAWAKAFKELQEHVEECARSVKDGEEEGCYELLSHMVEHLQEFSEKSSRFRSTVVDKAKIKAATQVYAHGASLSTAAKFAGVEKEELASYIGATKLPEKYETYSVKERLKMAHELFS